MWRPPALLSSTAPAWRFGPHRLVTKDKGAEFAWCSATSGGAAVEPRPDSVTVTPGSDPKAWPEMQHSLNGPRAYHHTVLLADGRLLAVGGIATNRAGADRRSETFDATARKWTCTGESDLTGRVLTLTLLADGRAVAIGPPYPEGEFPLATWVFTPATNTWTGVRSPAGVMYADHTATLLDDGTVLVVVAKDAFILAAANSDGA